MADAPNPHYYEPPEGAEDLPCECEWLVIARAVKTGIEKALDGLGVRLDWRKDIDLYELAEKVAEAVEYGLCDSCAREAAGRLGRLRRPRA